MYFIWTLDKALKEAQRIEREGLLSCISFLPVETKNKEDVARNTREYLKILDHIKEQGVHSDVTLKLHQFGVYKFPEFMLENVEKVVVHAKKLGLFVWVDMERPDTVDITIELFNTLRKNHANVGICIQTCLKRSENDMRELLKDRVPMRLVKGGFYIPYDIADWAEVSKNFSNLMEYMLEHSDRPCIATHDLELIEKARQIIKEKNITNAEFQFFYGVKNNIAKNLQKEGFRTMIYVPYGNLFTYMWHGLYSFDKLRNIKRVLRFKTIK